MVEMLTTLTRAQAWMAPDQGQLVSSTDGIVQRLIVALSRLTMNAMGRDTLQRTARTETYAGGRTGILLLRQWPVLSVESLGIGTTTLDTNRYSLEGARPAGGCQRIYLTQGQTFQACGPNGVSVAYTSGFVTTETLVASDTAYVFPSQMWLADHGVLDQSGAPITGYTVDADNGYALPPAYAGQSVTITYSYVPGDIEQVVIDEIAAAFRSRDRIGLASKALPNGGGTVSYLPRALLPISKQALASYMRVVPL